MWMPHSAERQIQQFPFAFYFYIDFCGCKLSGYIVSTNIRFQGNSAPYNGCIVNNFSISVMNNGILILYATAFNDLKFPGLIPGSAHVHKF